jgi:hypothetical protein
LANEQLRVAVARAGIEAEDLATGLQVDIKTVHRWLAGRIPRARHRARIAELLDSTEHDLWPDLPAITDTSDDGRDLAGVYLSASDIRAPDWRTLIPDARHRIDLLDSTLNDILTAPGIIQLLADKAADGTLIRILIAHPTSIWVTAQAQQLGLDQADEHGHNAVDRELHHSLQQLRALTGRPGITAMTYWAERTLSILRVDDEMLVHQHLHATPTTQSPLIHLRRRGDNGLFDRYLRHVDQIAERSSEPIPTDLLAIE